MLIGSRLLSKLPGISHKIEGGNTMEKRLRVFRARSPVFYLGCYEEKSPIKCNVVRYQVLDPPPLEITCSGRSNR